MRTIFVSEYMMANSLESNPELSPLSENPSVPSLTFSASIYPCIHNFSVACDVCPDYDECPYPDRSSSLMSVVLPAGITVMSIVTLLTVLVLLR